MIKIGIIGVSDGNGHPYSFSAIFNGYNREAMRDIKIIKSQPSNTFSWKE